MHTREQLIHDLDLGTEAGLLTQAVDRGAHGLEHRVGDRVRRGGARRHHGQLSGRGARGTTGDGGVQVEHTPLGQPSPELSGPARVDRGAHHEDGPRAEPGGGPVGAEQHRLDLGRVDHDTDHDVHRGRQVAGGGERRPAVAGEALGHLRSQIVDPDLVARFPQAASHTESHGPEPHHAHAWLCRPVLVAHAPPRPCRAYRGAPPPCCRGRRRNRPPASAAIGSYDDLKTRLPHTVTSVTWHGVESDGTWRGRARRALAARGAGRRMRRGRHTYGTRL